MPASGRAEDAAAYLGRAGLAVLGALDTVAERTGEPVAAIALAWLTAQPTVAAALASARTPRQLTDLLRATALDLAPDDVAPLSAASGGARCCRRGPGPPAS